MMSMSSAAVGGGFTEIGWAFNIGVSSDYGRTDLSDHAGEVAAELGLTGAGMALFTAAAVDEVCRSECGGVVVDATVGVTHPTWAADPTAVGREWTPGTINLVAQLPVGLEPGAAVNAVVTATEAKSQALMACGIAGTGTASDAVGIVWPIGAETERFAGPRSEWGSKIAKAIYQVVWGCARKAS